MSDLPEFLLARIAEDEAVARAAMPGPWLSGARDGAVVATYSTVEYGSHDGSTFALVHPGPEVWNPAVAMANATHIARHDPARVLAKCAADRQIVEEHKPYTRDVGWAIEGTETICDTCRYDNGLDAYQYPCPTIAALALPYADHPGYRPEWRP